MGLEAQFAAMSTQTITVESLSTAITSYGAPAYSTTPQTLTAYIEPGTRVVVNQQGVEEVATATLFVFSSSASIGPQSRITLPDGRTPKLLSVEPLNDDRGQHHIEIHVR
jgi:hypothetical protein